MLKTPGVSHAAEAEGFFKSLGASFRDHIDERLKSPFGGAFILAWFIVNWKALLILCFSMGTIEQRTEVFTASLDRYNAVFHPIWLAIVIAVSFYLFSALFIAISEIYQWLARSIRRPFDSVTWVHPEKYVQLKSENAAKVRYFIEVASDNLKALDDEQQKTTAVAEQLLAVQGELSEAVSALNEKNIEISTMQGAQGLVRSAWAEKESEFVRTEDLLDVLISDIRKMSDSAQTLAETASQTNIGTHPVAWNNLLSITNRLKNSLSIIEEYRPKAGGDVRLTEAAVIDYLDRLYPSLQANQRLLPKVLADLRATPETMHLNTVAQLDAVMKKASEALAAYAKSEPELFKYSSDYLSKALGFVFKEYRSVHKFGKTTMQAFETYDHLLRNVRD